MKYKKCKEITKEECPSINNRNCHVCGHCLDTSKDGWCEGDYYCTLIKDEGGNKMNITIKKSEDSKRVDFTVNGQTYHTNNDGYGLWIGEDYTKQIEGTAQVSLTQKTTSGMRKAIEKKFSDPVED